MRPTTLRRRFGSCGGRDASGGNPGGRTYYPLRAPAMTITSLVIRPERKDVTLPPPPVAPRAKRRCADRSRRRGERLLFFRASPLAKRSVLRGSDEGGACRPNRGGRGPGVVFQRRVVKRRHRSPVLTPGLPGRNTKACTWKRSAAGRSRARSSRPDPSPRMKPLNVGIRQSAAGGPTRRRRPTSGDRGFSAGLTMGGGGSPGRGRRLRPGGVRPPRLLAVARPRRARRPSLAASWKAWTLEAISEPSASSPTYDPWKAAPHVASTLATRSAPGSNWTPVFSNARAARPPWRSVTRAGRCSGC